MVDCSGKAIAVSVMITYYNQKDFVKDSLLSVLEQRTDFNYEILIGDDGSSDGTIEEIKQYIKAYPNKIKLFVMPRDNGKLYEPIERVSANRINLLKNSQGEFGIFLDGDDVYSDEYKLQKQIEFLRANQDCIGCGHPLKTFGEWIEKGEILGKLSDKTVKLTGKEFWKYYYVSADTFMFRNIVKADSIKLTSNFDDNSIIIHFVDKGKIGILPDCMVKYRQTAGSSWNKRDEMERIYINLKDYVEEIEYFPEFKRESFIRHLPEIYRLFVLKKKICSYGKYEKVLGKMKIFRDFANYNSKSWFGKFIMNIRYSYLFICNFFVKVTRKLSALKLR